VTTSNVGRKALVSLAVGLALGTATDGFAQQQPEGQKNLEEIVVTGSRIARRDYTSQSPLVTVDKEAFNSRSNVGIEATLDQLPQFNMTGAGSQATNSAAGTPFPQASAAPGAATINLRGLGLNRSLILVNGRRMQPVNGLLVVDLNTIPAAAIDRVEVITGGAAAVYGADAIAGVVNFVLKKNFEGVQINAQSSISEQGDGAETSISGLLGASFADNRGSVMIGADYSKREIILGKDRSWVRAGWDDPGTNPGGIGGSNLSQMTPTPGNGPAGYVLPAGRAYVIDQNGKVFDSVVPNDPAHPYTGPLGGSSGFKLNPSDGSLGWNDTEHNYLQLPLERYSIFGSGHILVGDNIDVFTEAHFAESFASASGFQSSVFNVWSPTVPYNHLLDNPGAAGYNPATSLHPVPAQFAALLNTRPNQDGAWTYVGGLDYLPNFRTETTSNVYQIIGGLESDFMVGKHDWHWEVSGSHGKTSAITRQPEGFPFKPRIQNLFNATQYGKNFDISSLPGYSPVAVTGHCTSGLPIFNADGTVNNTPTVSQDCADYVVLRMNDITTLAQDIIDANVTGSFLDMKSGPIGFAVGVDYRNEDFRYDPDSGFNANQDFPNVIQNVVLPLSVAGSTDVKEFYGELAIPMLKNHIELDPAYRYSKYDTVGGISTYKLTGDFKVNDWFRFRGGYQFANRAPNVAELFTPKGGTSLTTGNDACAYYANGTPTWGNRPENPNRTNLQILCQFLMTREGAPASLYVPGPGGSADTYNYNVFGGQQFFPFVLGVTEGNPNAQAESSDTYTLGFVMNVPKVDRLTLSLDWWSIKLTDAIGIPGHDTIYRQCLDAQYNSLIGSAPGSHTGAELAANNPFCALIQREYVGGAPLTPGNYGADRKYKAQYINQGGIETAGYDLVVDWRVGNFDVNFQGSLLDNYSEAAFPGAQFVDYTDTSYNNSFQYRTFTTVQYARNSFSVGVRWQHLPEIKPAPGSAPNVLGTDSHDQFDLFGAWRFKDRWQLRGGITNALNADPEVVLATTINHNLGSTNSNYDQVGRSVYLGLTVTL